MNDVIGATRQQIHPFNEFTTLENTSRKTVKGVCGMVASILSHYII
jgi:hypothetical protein